MSLPRTFRLVGALAFVTAPVLLLTPHVEAAIVPAVGLGTASGYSVLGATTVTNTGPSVLAGSVGLSPGTAVVGFPPGIVLPPATVEATSAVTDQAQTDLTAAYDDAAGRPVEFTRTNPDLVGQTLSPGVYAASAKAPLGLSGRLVLDGQGDPDAVFVFQTDSTLITGSGSTIELVDGASECNVFWQVGSSATLGSGSVFVGNILALTSVTVESAVVVHGRALARTGAVTLDSDTFTGPSCEPAPSATSTTTTTTPGTTPSSIAATSTTIAGVTGTTTVAGTTVIVDSTVASTLPATGSTTARDTALLAALALAAGIVSMGVARRAPQPDRR